MSGIVDLLVIDGLVSFEFEHDFCFAWTWRILCSMQFLLLGVASRVNTYHRPPVARSSFHFEKQCVPANAYCMDA